MKKRIAFVASTLAIGCMAGPAPAPLRVPPPVPDSIVLERTRCFGFCPSYRLSLTKAGAVSFANGIIDTTETILPDAFARLSAGFDRIGFSSLPGRIREREEFCKPIATDMPSAIVTVFAPGKMKTVDDYHGCFGTHSTKRVLRDLRLLEDQVDSTAGASRWISGPKSR